MGWLDSLTAFSTDLVSQPINREYDRSAENREAEKNIQFWNMQNAYNSPLNQRKRLIEGGYNPHLFYGQGTVGNSSAPPASVASKRTVTPMQNPLQAGYDMEMRRAQIQKTNAETDLLNRTTPSKESILSDEASMKKGEAEAKLTRWEGREMKNSYDEDAQQNQSRTDNLKANNAILNINIENLDEKQKKVIELLKEQVNNAKTMGKVLTLQELQGQFEVELNKMGLTKNDPYYIRISNKIADILVDAISKP